MSNILELPNYLVYLYKRSNWVWSISRLRDCSTSTPIDRPIFLLGTHGGGLTLISRMLRRNKQVVSVTGDYSYWSGADEMQVVLGRILPAELTGIRHKLPPHPKFGAPRGWLYATDELISAYRKTESDVTPELREIFTRILKWVIARHGTAAQGARFTDKSQVYTVKVAFIRELLRGTAPKFILVTRDPYALCYRSAKGKAGGLRAIADEFSFSERLELASQHWANSMRYALLDGVGAKDFLVTRFEDVLNEPEKLLRRICEFVELDFHKDMLPQPYHKVPFGSRFRDRWYPLRPEVNQQYLEKMLPEHVAFIAKRCEKYAKQFGYEKPEL